MSGNNTRETRFTARNRVKCNSLYIETDAVYPYLYRDLKVLILEYLMRSNINLITMETGLLDQMGDHTEYDKQVDWVAEEDI